MNNKFENENEEENTLKKRLLDRTVYKNTGPNLCLSIHIKSLVCLVSVFIYKFSYL